MTTHAKFWDKAAEKYVASPMKDPENYQRWLARVKAHLKATDKIAELGCGSGATSRELAPLVEHVTATDISPRMIEIGQEIKGPDNVTYQCAQISDLEGPYDAVLAFNLVHLYEEPVEEFKRIHERLNAGGLFISKSVCIGTNPLLGPLMWVVVALMRMVGKAPYLALLTPKKLTALIEAGGFEIIEEGAYPEKGWSRVVIARKS